MNPDLRFPLGATTNRLARDTGVGNTRHVSVHAVYGAMKTIEGEAADGVVILEFPDTTAARAWYYSDEYKSRAKYRMAAAPYRGLIIEGI